MKPIYRVETPYGCRDYKSLKEAKKTSKTNDHIQLVFTDGLTIMSRVKAKYATNYWVKRIFAKYGFEYQ